MFIPVAAVLLGLFTPACLGQNFDSQDALAILEKASLFDPAHHRELQSSSCANEESQADSCLASKFSSTSSSEFEACSACLKQALKSVLDSLAGSTSLTCQDFDQIICTPVESCPCFGSCSALIGEGLECEMKASYPAVASCSITCQNPASGSISIATGLGYGMTGMTALAFALM
jgi:hypothetical protein